MRVVTYRKQDTWRSGLVVDGLVVDSAEAAREAGLVEDGRIGDWTSSRLVAGAGPEKLLALGAAAEQLAELPNGRSTNVAVRDALIGPPISDPDKIVCLGLNYREHAAEASLEEPEAPMLFAKYRNSLIGPDNPIIIPRASEKVDYEGELAVVIGRQCKEVSEEEALDYVSGYMALNDVSARDLQLKTSQWMAGKALDTFAPCGPALVPAVEVEGVQNLDISTRVNGETVQQANTSMMIFSVRQTISFISSLMTLEPGDIIATGTPSGVGFKRNPPLFLTDGDVVEVDIEGVGTLRNPVVGPDHKESLDGAGPERTTSARTQTG